jgi:hypothetical protein
MPLHIWDANRLTRTACCSPSSASQADKPDGAHVVVSPMLLSIALLLIVGIVLHEPASLM